MHNNEKPLYYLEMDRKRATIVFSMIAVVAIAGTSIPLGYSGLISSPDTSSANGSSVLSPIQENNNNSSGNNDNSTSTSTASEGNFRVIEDPNLPQVNDANLRVEKVIEGMHRSSSMAFLDNDDVLILEKDNGIVRHVSNGTLQQGGVLELLFSLVEFEDERGLLGIAVSNEADDSSGTRTVFLYYTESAEGGEVRNRVYRYDWTGSGKLSGETLVLDLPGTPGPDHNGGKLIMGPDGMLYAVIGDLHRDGKLQNFPDGGAPDDTSVILRVDHEGNAPGDGGNNSVVLSDSDAQVSDSLSRYYAYGIRNSFGMDFDPVTGTLWTAENGQSEYDEINVVEPGFNSGWEPVMGPIERTDRTIDNLVQFNGSHYADPVFSWLISEGITDIEFLNSTRLGDRYTNNIFVGNINNGTLYFFTVNDDRTGLTFDGSSGLADLVADNTTELSAVTFGTGFEGGITDIETGPDGYLYILSFNGSLYRIVPATS
jgi:glucose/arabinose dehydrogenase